MAKKAIAAKKRVVKIDGVGQLHVMSSFNNVIVTVANGDGQVISWSSAGKQGFRGSKKILRTQHKWQQQIAARLHSTSVCVKLKHTLRVPDKDVNRLSVPASQQVLT